LALASALLLSPAKLFHQASLRPKHHLSLPVCKLL
jgi:hypothetical protein